MKGGVSALCLLALHSSTPLFVAGSTDHPIVGVIALLQNLKAQVRTEGETEAVTYAKFEKWCSDSTKSLGQAVADGKENIDILKDKVESLKKEEATLTEQIAMLTQELADQEKLAGEAEKARTDENALYTQADKDLADTIAAFESAITELAGAKTATDALLQAKALRGAMAHLTAPEAGRLSDLQIQRLSQVLSRASADPAEKDIPKDIPDFLAKGDYGAHVKKYDFKSDTVVDLLKELKLTLEDQKVDGTKRETSVANGHALAKSARDAAVAAAISAKDAKTTALGSTQTSLAETESSLDSAKADLVADEASLTTTQTDCRMKSDEWKERSKTRELEIEAIKAGIEILAQVTGVRTEAPSNPALPVSPVAPAFLQSDPKSRALNILRQEAARAHSKSFMLFTKQLEAKLGGPFDEVNNMIQKMIFRLMAEQTDEDTHKNWCDLELSKTNTSIEDKTGRINELDLKIEADKATVQLLGTEALEATTKVAEISAFIEESTEIRSEGRSENEQAIHDAKKAQEAVAKAVAVLQGFYKDSGMVAKEAWEFVQRNSAPVELPASPSTWEAGYTGVADPKNQPAGIITVLEKIAADFSKMEADSKAQEATDEKNYQEAKSEAQIEKARREKEGEMKTQEQKRLLEKVQDLEKSKKHTTAELEAQKIYLKDLNPACVEGDSTYEDRKLARENEILALKDAQVVLADAFKGTTAAPSLVQIRPANFS